MELLLTAVGLILIIEGIPWFLSPRGMRSLFSRVLSVPDSVLRFSALAAMVAGLLTVWFGQG